MDDKGYNGWTNYETWAMALWIDNDQGSYEYASDAARNEAEYAADNPETYLTTDELARYNLANTLKVWQEDSMPGLPASVWADLLRSAFESIDWYEIATNYLSEVDA